MSSASRWRPSSKVPKANPKDSPAQKIPFEFDETRQSNLQTDKLYGGPDGDTMIMKENRLATSEVRNDQSEEHVTTDKLRNPLGRGRAPGLNQQSVPSDGSQGGGTIKENPTSDSTTDALNDKSAEHDAIKLKDKVRTLVEQCRVLGLSQEEIRAYLDPTTCPSFLTGSLRKGHVYRAHFRALRRRGLLWQALKMPPLFSSPLTWRKRFKLPVLLAVLLLSYRAAAAVWSSASAVECLIENSSKLKRLVLDVIDPPFPCELCRNLTAVPEVRNITQEQFDRSFAFTGLPVLVKGAARHWRALDTFSFDYFKSLYRTHNDMILKKLEKYCQFFDYSGEFKTLSDALRMSPERAAFKEGERSWYIGWSIIHPKIRMSLKQHYEQPYFFPPDVEFPQQEWIFIGGPGMGANLHNDRLPSPSWQAQVSGTKTWMLVPSVECSSICQALRVTVEKGDILLVDTKAWYHATVIHPSEISITIGTEYF